MNGINKKPLSTKYIRGDRDLDASDPRSNRGSTMRERESVPGYQHRNRSQRRFFSARAYQPRLIAGPSHTCNDAHPYTWQYGRARLDLRHPRFNAFRLRLPNRVFSLSEERASESGCASRSLCAAGKSGRKEVASAAFFDLHFRNGGNQWAESDQARKIERTETSARTWRESVLIDVSPIANETRRGCGSLI